MVLTATLTAGLTAGSGKAGVRQLLHAAVGCNIAWGIMVVIGLALVGVAVLLGG
jgi:hypothetical protein